jgi:hypothetical protein
MKIYFKTPPTPPKPSLYSPTNNIYLASPYSYNGPSFSPIAPKYSPTSPAYSPAAPKREFSPPSSPASDDHTVIDLCDSSTTSSEVSSVVVVVLPREIIFPPPEEMVVVNEETGSIYTADDEGSLTSESDLSFITHSDTTIDSNATWEEVEDSEEEDEGVFSKYFISLLLCILNNTFFPTRCARWI